MPMFQLEKLLERGKEADTQVLDLAEATADDAEEFQKLFSRVPELKTFKIRPEKVRDTEVEACVQISTCSSNDCFRLQSDPRHKAWLYADPVPLSMRSASIPDLATKDISWRMLTDAKPSTKSEDDYFTRLVDLAKSSLAQKLHDPHPSKPMGDAPRQLTRRLATSEFKVRSCIECLEEMCRTEACMDFGYDDFQRELQPEEEVDGKEKEVEEVEEKKTEMPFKMGPPRRKKMINSRMAIKKRVTTRPTR